MDRKDFARTILDALDVDFQVFSARAIRGLRRSPTGTALAIWAEEHPMMFGTLLRFVSVVAQRFHDNNSLIISTIADQLARMPAEFKMAFGDSRSPEPGEPGKERKTIHLKNMTRQDAELLQAAQAPPELLSEWLSASETDRPFLMAGWISEGRVPLIEFSGSDLDIPGFYYLNKGRDLLAQGRMEEAFRYLRMSFVFSPWSAPNAFVLWLATHGNVAKEIYADPRVLAFVSKEYSADTAAHVLQMRAERAE
jgi:hypothetical protein